MKKILLSLSVMAFAGVASAQTVLGSENFNATTGTSLPASWTQSGDGWKTGTPATINSQSWGIPGSTDGRALAINDDAAQANAYNDQFVKSSPFDLSAGTASNLFLKVDLLFAGGTYQGATETLKIEVSTDGGNTWNVLQTVAGYMDLAWHTKYVSLASYAGQSNVMIGFRYSDAGGWLFGAAIDNFTLMNVANYDLALNVVAPVQYQGASYGTVGSNKSITGVVSNNGGNAVTSYTVKYQQGANPVQSYVKSVNIPAFGTDTFTHNVPFTIPSVGEFPINVWVEQTGDQDATNNQLSAFVQGVASMPTKRLLFEEGTGTWCGWCPRGTVAMDEFAETHPGVAAQVAVHNGDPMTVSTYDQFIGGFISGYPSMVIERNYVEDPGDLEAVYNALSGSFGYADITLGAPAISGNSATITATINPAVDINNAKIALIVTESNLSGPAGSNWDQANYYSGGGSGVMGGFENEAQEVANTNFHFVARSATPSPGGDAANVPAVMTAGGTYTVNLTTNLDASWNQANLQYVVALLGADGKTLNTAFTATPTLDPVLSVSNVAAGIEKMEAFPNPANNMVNIAFNLETATDIDMVITDITGKVVYTAAKQFNAGFNKVAVETASLSNGIYMITANTGKGKATLKLVVSH